MLKVIEMTGAEYKKIVAIVKSLYIGPYMPMFQYVQVHAVEGGVEFRVSNSEEDIRIFVAYDHSDHDDLDHTFGIPMDVFCGLKCGVKERVIINEGSLSAAGVSVGYNVLPECECPDSIIWVDSTWRDYPDLRFVGVADGFTDRGHDKFCWINVYEDCVGIHATESHVLYAVNHSPKKVVAGSIRCQVGKVMNHATNASEYSISDTCWRICDPCSIRGLERLSWEYRGKLHKASVPNIDRVIDANKAHPGGSIKLRFNQECIRHMQGMCTQLVKLGMPRKHGHLSGAVRLSTVAGSIYCKVEYVALDGRDVSYSVDIPMLRAADVSISCGYDIDHWGTCVNSIISAGDIEFTYDSEYPDECGTIIRSIAAVVILMPYKLK